MPSGNRGATGSGGNFGVDSANQMAANSRSRGKMAGPKQKEESKSSNKMGSRGVSYTNQCFIKTKGFNFLLIEALFASGNCVFTKICSLMLR